MKHFGTFEAKNRLSAILDMVEGGEEVTITRNGKAIARIIPATTSNEQKEKAIQAARELLEMRDQVKPDPEGLTIRDYIAMGPRRRGCRDTRFCSRNTICTTGFPLKALCKNFALRRVWA